MSNPPSEHNTGAKRSVHFPSPGPALSPAVWLTGILTAGVAGGLLTEGWRLFCGRTEKVYGAGAVLIGIVVGLILQRLLRQGGLLPALTGGVLTLGMVLTGYILIVMDSFTRMYVRGGLEDVRVSVSIRALQSLRPIDWLFVAIALYPAVTFPLQGVRRHTSSPNASGQDASGR